MRTQFANEASPVSPAQVQAVRIRTSDRVTPYRFDELVASVPRPIDRTDGLTATASHSAPTRIGGTAEPEGAFTHEGWTTGKPQRPGMWFQVRYPAVRRPTELEFEAPPVYRESEAGEDLPPLGTAPRHYEVAVSMDGASWKTVASGQAEG